MEFNISAVNEKIRLMENIDIVNSLLFLFGVMSFTKILADFVQIMCGNRYILNQHLAELRALEGRIMEQFERQQESLVNLVALLDKDSATTDAADTEVAERESQTSTQESQTQEMMLQTEANDETSSLQSIEAPANVIGPNPTQSDDKHALLRKRLQNEQVVYVTYKKTTFPANFVTSLTAPHGYVIRSGDTEYHTPSHFSYAKKSSLNPTIHSDNGWDSVYILEDVNGKATKSSLKAYIQRPLTTTTA